MQPWHLLLGLFAGALGIGALASSTAKASQAGQAATSAADDALLNRAVSAALAQEHDVATLDTFSAKLRAAGYASYADAIGRRANMVSGRLTSPLRLEGVQMVQQ